MNSEHQTQSSEIWYTWCTYDARNIVHFVIVLKKVGKSQHQYIVYS